MMQLLNNAGILSKKSKFPTKISTELAPALPGRMQATSRVLFCLFRIHKLHVTSLAAA